MKALIFGLVTLFIAVALVAFAHDDPGYVLITYRDWTLESSLVLLIIMIALAFLILYYGLRLWGGTLSLPGRLRRWQKRRRASQARKALADGLTKLAEGNWQSAERTLIRRVRDSKSPLLNYLAAAKAAQEQGELDRRDNYLEHATEGLLTSDLAVNLTKAKLHISRQELDPAAKTLSQLHDKNPRNNHVLMLLAEVYINQKDWHNLQAILPEIRNRRIFPKEKTDDIERSLYISLLEESISNKNVLNLKNLWLSIPQSIRNQEQLIYTYTRGLLAISRDSGTELEPMVYDGVTRHGSDALIYLYGLINTDDAPAQLTRAEKWLKHQQRNPVILLTLGRLAQRCQLWGKARSYLEASLGIAPEAETYYTLGTLLERINDKEEAVECYRKAAALTLQKPTEISASPTSNIPVKSRNASPSASAAG